jgi:DNA polymerase-3 subunit beta
MKIEVQKEELYRKLSDIQNVVEKKDTMPVLNHFLLTVKDDGSYITATDLENAVREPINAHVFDEGSICIPAKKFFEIVKELDGSIEIEALDSQWIRIKSGQSNFRLACLSPEDFPVWPSFEGDLEKIELPASLMKEMIDKTLYAAGEADTRYVLNSLLLHIRPEGELLVVGTDGHRLALLQKKIDIRTKEEKKLIISRKAIAELRRFLADDSKNIKLTLGKNYILFNINDVEFLTRLIDGAYPNYEQVIPKSNEKILIADRESMIRSLKRVSIMSKERSNAVRIDLSQDGITMSASNPDMGEATEEMALQYNSSPMSLFFNARYIIDVLNAMSSDSVVFKFNEPLSPAIIMQGDKEDYICIVMPMRG